MKSQISSNNQRLHKFLRFLPIKKYTVEGQSMLPTLSPGMTVLATTVFFELNNGDLVAILHPKTGKVLIKRIYTISKEGIDVRGDNVTASTDSRHFGLLPRKKIIAKVFSFW